MAIATKRAPSENLKPWMLRTSEDLAAECLAELNAKWNEFKDHFTVELLPLLGDLETVVDKYFAVKAPFSEGKPKEFPDAFVLSALHEYHKKHKVNIAVVSLDGDFKNACALLGYLQHFSSLEDYANAFKPELSREEHAIEQPVDPTRPIVTEDLPKLKGILNPGPQATAIERKRVISLLHSRGQNYDYFFRNASDVFWIPLLKDAGLFDRLPEPEILSDGTTKIPNWEPVFYLERVFDAYPAAVVRILEA